MMLFVFYPSLRYSVHSCFKGRDFVLAKELTSFMPIYTQILLLVKLARVGSLAGEQLSLFVWIGCGCIFMGIITSELRLTWMVKKIKSTYVFIDTDKPVNSALTSQTCCCKDGS